MRLVPVFLIACGGAGAPPPGDSTPNPDANDHVQDPNDPVEDVPPYAGAYAFAKLTTDDVLQFSGTFFTDDSSDHEVTATRVCYARYRDGMVLHSKLAAEVYVYDQASTTIGTPIALPSDAIGQAVIRGGMLYIGGSAKLYSYELATQMWRSQPIPSTGACHHVAVGTTRLFAICANATDPHDDDLFSTWANKAMSDVVSIGTVAPGQGAEFGWLAVAPGSDTAYFNSEVPDRSCVGRMTLDAHEPCAFSLATLTTLTNPLPNSGQVSEDGATLYVTLFAQDADGKRLYEVDLATPSARLIRKVESYATCPDNGVIFQDGTISQRRLGGVTTDVRLGAGGQADMGCPLQKL
jgi:hypothetical protein